MYMHCFFLLPYQESVEFLASQIQESNQSVDSSLGCVLLILLLVDLFVGIVNFISQIIIKKMEVRVTRRNAINTNALSVEKELYDRLLSLCKVLSPTPDLLDMVSGVVEYKDSNKLIIRDNLLKIATELTDYFSIVVADFKRKDIKKENKLMAKYKKKYHG